MFQEITTHTTSQTIHILFYFISNVRRYLCFFLCKQLIYMYFNYLFNVYRILQQNVQHLTISFSGCSNRLILF